MVWQYIYIDPTHTSRSCSFIIFVLHSWGKFSERHFFEIKIETLLFGRGSTPFSDEKENLHTLTWQEKLFLTKTYWFIYLKDGMIGKVQSVKIAKWAAPLQDSWRVVLCLIFSEIKHFFPCSGKRGMTCCAVNIRYLKNVRCVNLYI